MDATKRAIFAPDLLSDKRILITCGGTGLGPGLAARLVKPGARSARHRHRLAAHERVWAKGRTVSDRVYA